MKADAATVADEGTPSPDLVALLETRVTSMRLSRLLMIMHHMGRNADVEGPDLVRDDALVAVTKVLLRYGAGPDARDVVGKTVFHYGAGAQATCMTLAVADLCLQALEEGSHLFGNKVTLVGLSPKTMNGLEGIVLGFDVDTGRRYLSLPDGSRGRRKKVAIKPENLRLATDAREEEVESRPLARLCDIPDRTGSVCFMEVIFQERVDVAKYLLEREARIDIPSYVGISPISIAMTPMSQLSNQVFRLIYDYAASTARRARRKLCSSCGEDEKNIAKTFNLCSACKVMRYCSKECQLWHWKTSHKVECRAIQAKKEKPVVLECPPAGTAGDPSVAMDHARSKDPRNIDGGLYQMPRGVRAGQKFTIRVQASGTRDAGSLLLYNKARDCSFSMGPGQAGFTDLYDAVKAEKTFNATITYMKALFDEAGNCVAFPGDTSIHT